MIHVERITVKVREGNNPNNADKEVVFKNCALFTKVNNT